MQMLVLVLSVNNFIGIGPHTQDLQVQAYTGYVCKNVKMNGAYVKMQSLDD
jgi:hypothetical protein